MDEQQRRDDRSDRDERRVAVLRETLRFTVERAERIEQADRDEDRAAAEQDVRLLRDVSLTVSGR
ncbi:MAG TPA: hypothetical protein VF763_00565 [Candidatus Limnocylindrales bacterium]